MIDAEFDELEPADGELDLSNDDSLPWLEADEEGTAGGGVDAAQLFGFVAILLVLLVGTVGAIWYFANRNSAQNIVADGSTIEAPEGPYKDRPGDEERGGRVVEGTGNVAPQVAQGEVTDSQMASATGAGSGDQDLNIAMPPIAGGSGRSNAGGANVSTPSATSAEGGAASSAKVPGARASEQAKPPATQTRKAAPASGPSVQLAAYSTRSRAEQGWRDISRRTSALKGMRYRVVEGQVDIGTVYRLQALPGDKAAADRLCKTLKSEGIDCQVKN